MTVKNILERLFSIFAKVPVPGTLVPVGGENAMFPIAVNNQILGGVHIYDSLEEVIDIPISHLQKGMEVWVNTDPRTKYELKSLPSIEYDRISDIGGASMTDFWKQIPVGGEQGPPGEPGEDGEDGAPGPKGDPGDPTLSLDLNTYAGKWWKNSNVSYLSYSDAIQSPSFGVVTITNLSSLKKTVLIHGWVVVSTDTLSEDSIEVSIIGNTLSDVKNKHSYRVVPNNIMQIVEMAVDTIDAGATKSYQIYGKNTTGAGNQSRWWGTPYIQAVIL